MFWEEKRPDKYAVPDTIVDLTFRIRARTLPLDHAHALSRVMHNALPWFGDDEAAGLHLIHVAETGNGWYRPDDPDTQVLCLSRRTKLTLRLPRERVGEATVLTGQCFDIDGHELTIGDSSVRSLVPMSTIFSRHVLADEAQTEEEFLETTVATLADLGIDVHKILCGLSNTLNMPGGKLFTRHVMLADMPAEESIRLQQQGLGDGRKFGCGLFIPHKGIEAVNKSVDD